MWVAKIRINSEGTLIGEKCKKYNVDILGFPLSYSYDSKWVIVQLAGTIFGNEKDKKGFFREAKKEKRVINLEMNNDFIIGTIKDPIYMNDLYQKDIFYISPALISSKGYELIEIGSFNRKLLVKIASLLEKRYGGRLLSLEDKKIRSISVMKVHPDLTDKQKQAIELAVKNGYYHVPRKTSVEKLAKFAGLSFSTFQVHLRKAEEKLIPYSFE